MIVRGFWLKHHESEEKQVFEVPPFMQYNLKHESSMDGKPDPWQLPDPLWLGLFQ
jgi:hypothetical protein